MPHGRPRAFAVVSLAALLPPWPAPTASAGSAARAYLRWSSCIPSTEQIVLSADGGLLFAQSGSCHLHIVDAQTGLPVWDTRVLRTGCWPGHDYPLLGRNNTFFAPFSGRVRTFQARDARSGQVRWRYRRNFDPFGTKPPAALSQDAALIFLGSADSSSLEALDAATGSLRWAYDTKGTIQSRRWEGRTMEKRARYKFQPALLGVEGSVYILAQMGQEPNVIHAVNATSGAARWACAARGKTQQLLQSSDGKVLFARTSASVIAVDVASGAVMWERAVGADRCPVLLSPDGLTLFAAESVSVVAMAIADGSQQWRSVLPESRCKEFTLTPDGGLLIVRDADIVTMATALGVVRWRSEHRDSSWLIDGQVWLSPDGRTVLTYPHAGEGKLLAFDTATGDVKWSRQLDFVRLKLEFGTRGSVLLSRPRLEALDPASGALLWSGPEISLGGTFVQSADGSTVFASSWTSLKAVTVPCSEDSIQATPPAASCSNGSAGPTGPVCHMYGSLTGSACHCRGEEQLRRTSRGSGLTLALVPCIGLVLLAGCAVVELQRRRRDNKAAGLRGADSPPDSSDSE